MKLKRGDIVTLKRGRSIKTKLRPDRPEGDLLGTKCMVLDTPMDRVGGASGKMSERVHVVPVEGQTDEPTGMFDVPTDYLRNEVAGNALDGGGRRSGRAISLGIGDCKLRPGERVKITYKTDGEVVVEKRTL